MKDNEKKTDSLLSRNIEEVFVKEQLEKLLNTGKKLRIYIGVDPSSPVIHLGHAVGLRKLREFQDLGHKVIFLIGDFTGRIGDPSDKNSQRVPLSEEEVKKNAQTYVEQAGKILDIDSKKNPIEIRYNAEWHDKLTFKELILISANFTVQQMIERDMYQKRIKESKPIGLHEFLYPVMQGYDSVSLDVDIELGGTDQTFNMLAGRTLMKAMKGKEKAVITVQLLLGTDGRKMSKSFGNVIGIMDAPEDMFGKVMSINDELIPQYLELATRHSLEEISLLKKSIEEGTNPRNIKFQLAEDIVTLYHGSEKAREAAEAFDRVFKDKENPENMPEMKFKSGFKIIDIALDSGLVSSKSEARRLIEQGGVKMNDKIIENINDEVEKGVLKIGRRKYLRII